MLSYIRAYSFVLTLLTPAASIANPIAYAAMSTLCPEVGCTNKECLAVNAILRDAMADPDFTLEEFKLEEFESRTKELLGKRKTKLLGIAAAQTAFQHNEPLHALPWLGIHATSAELEEIAMIVVPERVLDTLHQQYIAATKELFQFLQEDELNAIFGRPRRLRSHELRIGSTPSIDTYDAEILRLLASTEVQKELKCVVAQVSEIDRLVKTARQERLLPQPELDQNALGLRALTTQRRQPEVSERERDEAHYEITDKIASILDKQQYQRLRQLTTQNYSIQGHPDRALFLNDISTPTGRMLEAYDSSKMYLPAIMATVKRLILTKLYEEELSRILGMEVSIKPLTRICTSIRLREFPESKVVDRLLNEQGKEHPRLRRR